VGLEGPALIYQENPDIGRIYSIQKSRKRIFPYHFFERYVEGYDILILGITKFYILSYITAKKRIGYYILYHSLPSKNSKKFHFLRKKNCCHSNTMQGRKRIFRTLLRKFTIYFLYLTKNAFCIAKVPQNCQLFSKKDIG
jgi:hypothetical protein